MTKPTINRTHKPPGVTMNHANPVVILLMAIAGACLAHAGPASRVVSRIAIAAGDEALERGAREAAESAAAGAVKRLGIEGAEQAARRGGVALLQAGAKHGDEFWDLARRVPEASRYLASQPDQALALARRYGDDAVRLESRLPGVGRDAAQMFGKDRLGTLAQASPVEAGALVSFAKRADTAATRDALFDTWRRRGGAVLTELDKHKVLILTAGLTMGMIKVADGLEDGVRSIPEKVPQAVESAASKAGDALQTLGEKVGTGLMLGLIVLGAGIVLVWGFRAWLHRPPSRA